MADRPEDHEATAVAGDRRRRAPAKLRQVVIFNLVVASIIAQAPRSLLTTAEHPEDHDEVACTTATVELARGGDRVAR